MLLVPELCKKFDPQQLPQLWLLFFGYRKSDVLVLGAIIWVNTYRARTVPRRDR